MKTFLTPKYTFSITVKVNELQGKQLEADLETILKNLSLADINLLARASENQNIKTLAINQLKNIFKL